MSSVRSSTTSKRRSEKRRRSTKSSKRWSTRLRQLLRREAKLRLNGYAAIAGVDEAGRGPLAGPVVAGAVLLRDHSFTVRVDDSKRLSPKARAEAYLQIVEKAYVGVGIVDERTIDRINIHRSSLLAMRRALDNLGRRVDFVLVDGRTRLPCSLEQEAVIGGDGRCLSIACASIVAKVTRDRLMEAYDTRYPQYGFKVHKGYPTRRHKAALKRHGPSPIHRLTFSPVKDLIASERGSV